MEEWKDIEGYEGLYQVSNEGRVKSLEKTYITGNGTKKIQKEIVLKYYIYTNNGGYLYVILSKKGKRKCFKIHRLVAEAFIPNPNNYKIVHHKDHNPQNNKVGNLEWMNEDKHYKLHSAEKKEKYKGIIPKHVTPIPVYQYTLDGELVGIYSSATEAEKEGFNQSHIWGCCNGKRKKHKGYIWSYVPL